jgi:hypothetical protein
MHAGNDAGQAERQRQAVLNHQNDGRHDTRQDQGGFVQ